MNISVNLIKSIVMTFRQKKLERISQFSCKVMKILFIFVCGRMMNIH